MTSFWVRSHTFFGGTTFLAVYIVRLYKFPIIVSVYGS